MISIVVVWAIGMVHLTRFATVSTKQSEPLGQFMF
jgi:hypothetical protein